MFLVSREHSNFSPDIYVVGLQEIVKLNAKNCLIKDTDTINKWREMLENVMDFANKDNLANNEHFQMGDVNEHQLSYLDQSMVGCHVAFFFKQRIKEKLMPNSISPCKVKVGVKGVAGNKGAVCIRFQIEEQSFFIMNCHLASGRHKGQERVGQLATIFKSAFKNNLRNRGMTIENHSQAIILGDLNFRIGDMERDEVLNKVRQERIQDLLDRDDLIKAFDKSCFAMVKRQDSPYQDMLFSQFQEGHINFKPTYKYDLYSDQFDTSKKQRVPAYCDRILWKRNQNIRQVYYDSVHQVTFSDHRPVVAYFVLDLNDHEAL
mmetsp:Transcript_16082/g.27153  ORF Transcript_16082/g.27153 Transcript_16082/m.27153 type:complete len:319 (-) Transcript_16082:43-999(-)